MTDIREFDAVLPDPTPHIEKTLELYEQVGRAGRVVFISAELGGGKTELLNALARALHRADPAPTFVAGTFRGGQFHPRPLEWQKEISLNKAMIAVGGVGSLGALGIIPAGYAFAAAFIGQLLVTCADAFDFAADFQPNVSRGVHDPEWLNRLLSRATKERPLVCLIDDWDGAGESFAWNSMLISLARQLAQGLPVLLFVTLKGQFNSAGSEEHDTDLTKIVRKLTESGLAELWPLRKLSGEEVAAAIGKSAPGVAATLHGVTGGNARWVRELWREWRLSEIVVTDRTDTWVWGEPYKTTGLYERILGDRLRGLLQAEQLVEVEEVRDVLACAALEGVLFTADAVARVLGWERDELVDFLDDNLVQSEEIPDGLLLEEESVVFTLPDGTRRTLCRYSFVSDLQWMMLERYGFAGTHRPEGAGSFKLKQAAALVKALTGLYEPDRRLVARPLARLLREMGSDDGAQHYQRMSDYTAQHALLREQAFFLMALDKDNWGQWEYKRAVKFLNEAFWLMYTSIPYAESIAIGKESCNLAHHAGDLEAKARALYGYGYMSYAVTDYQTAQKMGEDSLEIYQRLGSKNGQATALNLLARIDNAEGNLADARQKITRALRLEQQINNRDGEATSLNLLARLDHEEDNYTEARRRANQALKLSEEIGELYGEADSLALLAQLDYEEGDYAGARQKAVRALLLMKETDNRQGQSSLHEGLARIARDQGEYLEARNEAVLAVEMKQELGDVKGMLHALDTLGDIAVHLKQPEKAFELVSLSRLILSDIGHAPTQHKNEEWKEMFEQRLTEEQRQALQQQVAEDYQKDGGKELINRALDSLRKATVE
jgi:tetratricopeptide (TPR) repeat protein